MLMVDLVCAQRYNIQTMYSKNIPERKGTTCESSEDTVNKLEEFFLLAKSITRFMLWKILDRMVDLIALCMAFFL